MCSREYKDTIDMLRNNNGHFFASFVQKVIAQQEATRAACMGTQNSEKSKL